MFLSRCEWIEWNRGNSGCRIHIVVVLPYIVATKKRLMSQQNTMLLLLLLLLTKWCQKAKNYQENINQSLSLLSLLLSLSTKYSPTLHLIAFDFIVKTKNSRLSRAHFVETNNRVKYVHSPTPQYNASRKLFFRVLHTHFLEHLIAGLNLTTLDFALLLVCLREKGAEIVGVCWLVCLLACVR